jgi:hypothetical protein
VKRLSLATTRDDGAPEDWDYAAAKKWLAEQDGFSFIMDADGRPMVVVTAWGLREQIVVRSNSGSAKRGAFVRATQLLARRLRDGSRSPP